MLNYIDTTYQYLTTWVRTVVMNKKSIVCVVTGGLDSCLNAALLLKSTSNIPVNLIFMGFKDTEIVFEKWVKSNFAETRYAIIKPNHPTFNDASIAAIDARSSLIPTYVDLYSKANSSVTFGSITKSEYSLVKFFKSRVDEIYDYYPLIDLYKSECIQLAQFVGLPEELVKAKSITEDSFGYSYDELEWLDRENNSLSIVSASIPPNFAPHWGLFNDRKKQLLIKVYQLNKENISKIIPDYKKCLIRKALPGACS